MVPPTPIAELRTLYVLDMILLLVAILLKKKTLPGNKHKFSVVPR